MFPMLSTNISYIFQNVSYVFKNIGNICAYYREHLHIQ